MEDMHDVKPGAVNWNVLESLIKLKSLKYVGLLLLTDSRLLSGSAGIIAISQFYYKRKVSFPRCKTNKTIRCMVVYNGRYRLC